MMNGFACPKLGRNLNRRGFFERGEPVIQEPLDRCARFNEIVTLTGPPQSRAGGRSTINNTLRAKMAEFGITEARQVGGDRLIFERKALDATC